MAGFEGHFETIYRRFDHIDHQFEAIDRRFESMERRIDALDQRVLRYFVWLVGIQVSVLLAVVAALVGG